MRAFGGAPVSKTSGDFTDSESQSQQPSGPGVSNACGRSIGNEIRRCWLERGGEAGTLGCPVDDEQEAPQSPQGTKGDAFYKRWLAGPPINQKASAHHLHELV